MKRHQFADEPEILKRVTVRLLHEAERPQFDALLEQKHYLCSAKMVGRTLRYVAELDGEWVALACFSAGALHLKAREKWIRWTPRQRARRLGFVVNNSRYLVLPERERLPNLASRALGLFLRRLSRDWQARWGHPVFVVESFVDETRYRGVCYRACGFEAVGPTAGFKRASRDFYHEHGEPKQLYLKELQPGARALLRRGRWPKELVEHEERIAGPCPWRAPDLESLLDRFRQLRDRRKGHGLRHRQPFVLACSAVAVLMGAGGYQAIEDTCRKFTSRQLRALGCQRNRDGDYVPPSDSTLFRVLSKVDTQQFDRIVGNWLLEQELSVVARLAVDGKVLRGSARTDGKPLQLLSAVTHRLRLTLAQVPVEDKSNEIPAFPKLLRELPKVDYALITADAMHCQQESARVTTQERGWDYLFGLKGNQSGVLDRAERLLQQQAFPP
jgi:hypothetical protein